MDFGVLSLDGGGFVNNSSGSDPETKQRLYGLSNNNRERSVSNAGNDIDDDWRSLKVAKSDEFSVPNNNKSMFPHQNQNQEQMLSFASPKSDALFYHRNTGYNCGNWNHGSVIGLKGPFTPSQWMELEHQALIYKYINSNVPIPSNLLIPIKKALDSALYSTFSGLPFRPNTLGWGSFHLGFSNSTDPEPGRCRRTDGKKWRCSRDAVADQKYCERHINRGRHRSRKPVEAQSGQSIASTTSTKVVPIASPSLGCGRGTPHSLAMAQHQQVKHLQPADNSVSNRMFANKDSLNNGMLDAPVLSMLSSTTTLNSKDSSFSIPKQHIPYQKSSITEFGHVSSDCLLNPANESFTFMNCRNYGSSSPNEIAVQETDSQHPLRHFMDDWPKNPNDRSTMSWPDMGLQSDRTQLSISIPMANSDSTSEKTALRLSRELDQIQMGLSVGSVSDEQNGASLRQANWVPISWENSVGGPLGEVLHNTSNNNKVDYKRQSALNLMTEGWDNNSPRVVSSPTGVLQKMAFGSVSNSSAGSSPRAEIDPLGSTLPCIH